MTVVLKCSTARNHSFMISGGPFQTLQFCDHSYWTSLIFLCPTSCVAVGGVMFGALIVICLQIVGTLNWKCFVWTFQLVMLHCGYGFFFFSTANWNFPAAGFWVKILWNTGFHSAPPTQCLTCVWCSVPLTKTRLVVTSFCGWVKLQHQLWAKCSLW